jgi:hypothetical protein
VFVGRALAIALPEQTRGELERASSVRGTSLGAVASRPAWLCGPIGVVSQVNSGNEQ